MISTVCAIIPARGGSKGVPGKNIKCLKGYPLIAYSIAAAKLSKNIQRIIISTDSEEIAILSRKYGADVPFLRPPELALDNSKDIDFMLHVIDWCEMNEKGAPEYWVHLRPTTPLRDPLIVDMAINQLINNSEATSLRSGHVASESPFKWFRRDDQGYFRGIIDNSTDSANNPRQQFPDVYIPDGYVDVLKSSFIKKTKTIHGNKMIGYISPFCTEVDTSDDFDYLQHMIDKMGSPLFEYLNTNHK